MRHLTPTNDMFTPTRFNTANDQRLTITATIRFLESGCDPTRLNKRTYEFFTQYLSMAAEYDRHGFITEWTTTQYGGRGPQALLHTAAAEINRHADMAHMRPEYAWATLFSADHNGPYADLLPDVHYMPSWCTGTTSCPCADTNPITRGTVDTYTIAA